MPSTPSSSLRVKAELVPYLTQWSRKGQPPKNHRPRQTEPSQSEYDNLLQQRVLSRRRAHSSQKRPTIWSLRLCERLAFMEQAGGPLTQHKQTKRICSVISSAAVQATPEAQAALPPPSSPLSSKNLSLKTWWQVGQSPSCPGCKISHQSKTVLMSYEQGWPRLAYRYYPPLDCSGRVSTQHVFAEGMNWTPRKTLKSMYKKQSGKLTLQENHHKMFCWNHSLCIFIN